MCPALSARRCTLPPRFCKILQRWGRVCPRPSPSLGCLFYLFIYTIWRSASTLCCSLARAEGMAAEEAGARLPGLPQTASRADCGPALRGVARALQGSCEKILFVRLGPERDSSEARSKRQPHWSRRMTTALALPLAPLIGAGGTLARGTGLVLLTTTKLSPLALLTLLLVLRVQAPLPSRLSDQATRRWRCASTPPHQPTLIRHAHSRPRRATLSHSRRRRHRLRLATLAAAVRPGGRRPRSGPCRGGALAALVPAPRSRPRLAAARLGAARQVGDIQSTN